MNSLINQFNYQTIIINVTLMKRSKYAVIGRKNHPVKSVIKINIQLLKK